MASSGLISENSEGMNTMLRDALEAGKNAVCVKDSRKKVLMQDDHCRSICGDQLGKVCKHGCMELYASDKFSQWQDWGSRVYQNSLIKGNYYDVTLLCSTESIITFLQPLKEKYEMALTYFRERGLTRREAEVIALTIRGLSNLDICEYLSISRATLRTHLNNVYRKFRESGEVPEFIPANRTLA
ncbi:MAG: LuxR C-terminal-related transcriptional regulator [Gammaproteobacteria bacterium]|nr:LuxR C-terminal-related transcriptional regulator [Gammaproteobacteria bacterium]